MKHFQIYLIFLLMSLSGYTQQSRNQEANYIYLRDDYIQYITDTLEKATFSKISNDTVLQKKYYLYFSQSVRWHLFKKSYKKTINLGIKFLNFATLTKNNEYLLEANRMMGNINIELKRYEAATKYIDQVLKLATLKADTVILVETHLGYAKLANKLGISRAHSSLYYALYLSEKSKNELVTAVVLKDIGLYYINNKDYTKALYYFKKSLKINEKYNKPTEIGVLLTLIGHIYQETGNSEISIKYGYEALEIRRKSEQKDLYIGSLVNLGKSYLIQNKFDSALYFLNKAEPLLNQINNLNISLANYYDLYLYYNKKNDPKNSLKYFLKYKSIQDTIEIEKSKNVISQYEANQVLNQLEARAKFLDTTNKLQQSEIKNKKIQLLLLFVLFIFMSSLAAFIYYILLKISKEKKKQEDLNKSLLKEINKRKELERVLIENQIEFRFIIDHSPDVIIREDANFKKRYVSPSCEEILGHTAAEIMKVSGLPDYIHEDSIEDWDKGIQKLLETKRPTTIVFKVKRNDSANYWAEILINPIFQDGELLEMVSVVRNVSDRLERREEAVEHRKNKELLIREVHHRTKNNMGILISLVRMHTDKYTDPEIQEFLQNLEFRIRSMAKIQDQLHVRRSIDELSIGPFLSGLIKTVDDALNDDRVELESSFYEEMVHVDILQPLGIIINELITNGFKYAFPKPKTGHIWVKYETVGAPLNMSRKLTIKDDGIGFPKDFDFLNRESTGSQLIGMLTQQLKGEILIDGSNGCCFTIILQVKGGSSQKV